eukprot:m.91477 g.91477  ORF g.91477 m.91477 type:complete len:131 (-) comp15040_c0_seq1:49-441(-)
MTSPGEQIGSLSEFQIFSFGKSIEGFGDMWKSIWIWSLLSFGVAHGAGGLIAFVNCQDLGPKRWTWLIPLVFGVLGMLIPMTAGVVTATMIAGVYSSAGFDMTTTEAFGWGVGQCIVYIIGSLSRNLSSL